MGRLDLLRPLLFRPRGCSKNWRVGKRFEGGDKPDEEKEKTCLTGLLAEAFEKNEPFLLLAPTQADFK